MTQVITKLKPGLYIDESATFTVTIWIKKAVKLTKEEEKNLKSRGQLPKDITKGHYYDAEIHMQEVTRPFSKVFITAKDAKSFIRVGRV